MNYLLSRKGRYYFNRRVPIEFEPYDPRKIICFALKTDSRKEAERLAMFQNDQLEQYWKKLIETGLKHESQTYEDIIKRARLFGFCYLTNQQIASESYEEIHSRLQHVKKVKNSEAHVVAVLGGVTKPEVKLDEAVNRHVHYSKGKVINKSENQFRKWINPRKLAMRTFIDCVGNKNISDLTRDDVLKYRDWWIDRVQEETVIPTTANKNLVFVKTVLQSLIDNLNIPLDVKHLFNKLLLAEGNETRRLPFETDFIRNILLNPDNLKGLNEQARCALYAMAETGAGFSEQVGLMPEDIQLNCDIPHIIVQPRHQKALKTKYRKRIIPLVGFALDAFRVCPSGFTEYRDKPDNLSGTVGSYLRENKLLPSDNHSAYSLRHSFQDRLLAVEAPDRVQADLMGHKFSRPSYGNGASLKQKLEWMEKIQLK